MPLRLSLLVVLLLTTISVFLAFLQWSGRKKLERSFGFILLEVQTPKYSSGQEEHVINFQNLFEAFGNLKNSFWGNSFLSPNYLGIEIAVIKKTPRFFLVVPRNRKNAIKKIVASIFKGAKIEESEDYTVFKDKNNLVVKKIKLSKDEFFPIDTSSATLTANLFELLNAYSEDDSFALQILFYPKDRKWIDSKIEDIKKETLAKQKNTTQDKEQDLHELNVKAQKLILPCVTANVRLIFTSNSEESLKKFNEDLEQLFEGLRPSSLNYNFFEPKDGDGKDDVFDFIFRNFNEGDGILLNSKEIAWMIQFF